MRQTLAAIDFSALMEIISILRKEGDITNAYELSSFASSQTEAILGPENIITSDSWSLLALVLSSQGNFFRALSLHERTLSLRLRILSKDHPKIAASLYNIAVNMWFVDDFKVANDCINKCLQMRIKLYSSTDYPSVLSDTYYMKGLILRSQGMYNEAIGFFLKCESIRKNHYGNDHLHVAQVLHCIGECKLWSGIYDDALKYFESSLETRRAVCEMYCDLSAPPPAEAWKSFRDVTRSLLSLVELHLALGNIELAETLLEQTKESLFKRLRKNVYEYKIDLLHYWVLSLRFCVTIGNVDMGKKYSRKSLKIAQEIFMKESEADGLSTEFSNVLFEIASFCLFKGEFDDAKHFVSECVKIRLG